MRQNRRFSILVVDDTPVNIDLLVEILGEDYDVRVALDGPSALEDMAEDLPDLVLLDIMMPGMDGYEVCRRIKSDQQMQEIPVIFVTAKGSVEDEVRGFHCGAVDYITKPISDPVVRARVATHLALRKARQELEDQNQILEDNIRLQEEVERISRHDLKTPLNKIVSLPGILMGDSTTPEGHLAALKSIEQAGFTMLGMINRSLDLVKMERNTYPLNPEAVDILAVVEKIISDLREEAQRKNCGFSIHAGDRGSDPAFFIYGEKLLCYSMAANLIKNALEACPEGSEIRISMSVSQAGTAEVSIHNPGAVPKTVRERFFDRYTTAGKKRGTGLGTYSALLMARTMNGDIAMTTGDTEGTCLRVTLPLPKDPGSTRRKRASSGRSFSLPDTGLPEMDLMIVDDDPDNLEILKKFLRHPALHLDQAADGHQAVAKWREKRHDLIFMDLEMPGMAGTQAVQAIRDLERPPRGRPVTVIALSAHDQDMARTCLASGFDGFLTKPVRPGDLFSHVQAVGERKATGKTGHRDLVTVDPDLEEIFPGFMKNKSDQIKMLEARIKALDFDGIRQMAHKLKGGFNMYGIGGLGGICAELETAAKDHNTDSVRDLGSALADRFSRIQIIFS